MWRAAIDRSGPRSGAGLAVSFALVLAVAACGGDSGGSKTDDGSGAAGSGNAPSGGSTTRRDGGTPDPGTGAAGAVGGGGAGNAGGGAGAGSGGSAGSTGTPATDAGSSQDSSTAGGMDAAVPATDAPVASGLEGTCLAMIDAATKLITAASAQQKAALNPPYNDANRTVWFYTPGERQGFDTTGPPAPSPEMKQLSEAFLQSALSPDGYVKTQVIREVEATRQRGHYAIRIFGQPSPTATWAWRFEGHHLSINFTVAKCTSIATTPAFMGLNFADAGGKRPLKNEQDLGVQLYMSLSAAQKTAARIQNRMVPERNVQQPKLTGGALASGMTAEQKATLRQLIGQYLGNMAPPLAAARFAEIDAAGFDNIGFVSIDTGLYYRVQGPTFLIEFDNAMGNHVHSVWRDYQGDFGNGFGPDLLKLHYDEAHQDRELPR
jgi:hypothetical protein